MRHKNADFLEAIAKNAELVVFASHVSLSYKWVECEHSDLFVDYDSPAKYFLCHPRHKEACLDWLNGSDYDVAYGNTFGELFSGAGTCNWNQESLWMNKDSVFTKRKKKVKRWGIYSEKDSLFSYVSDSESKAKNALLQHYKPEVFQVIEFEIEI